MAWGSDRQAEELLQELRVKFNEAAAEEARRARQLALAKKKMSEGQLVQLRSLEQASTQSIVNQVAAFWARYSRGPKLPPEHRTMNLALEEVELWCRFEVIRYKISPVQSRHIEDAKPGRHPDIAHAFSTLDKHYIFGNDRESTCRSDTLLSPSVEDYAVMMDLRALQRDPAWEVLSAIATRLGRKHRWKKTTVKSADGAKARCSEHMLSKSDLLYWCRCDVLRRFDCMAERLGFVLPESISSCAGFKTPQTLVDFAASLRDGDNALYTPIGDDFLDVQCRPKRSLRLVPQHDLLRHFMFLEAPHLECPPVPDSKVLRWFRVSSLRSSGSDAGITSEHLETILGEADMGSQFDWVSSVVGGQKQLVNVIDAFVTFCASNNLTECLSVLSARRMVTLAIWHRVLEITQKRACRWKARSHNYLTDIFAQHRKMPKYVTAAEVFDGEQPHFLEDAQHPFAAPVITAPRVCQLCGKGYANNRDLTKHQDTAHCGVAEVRKRVFWEAEQQPALPLSMRRTGFYITYSAFGFVC